LAILLFGFYLNWLPISGRLDVLVTTPPHISGLYLVDSLLAGDWVAFQDSLRHIILPASLLAFTMLAPIARLMRSGMLNELQEDYIRTARSKGLRERAILSRHALRNAILPVVTSAGLFYGQLLGGAVITETVFGW